MGLLLGLKPLEGETYIPEKTATEDFWNNKLEYLLRTRKGYWNDDYARFLVSQVWKIDKPVSIISGDVHMRKPDSRIFLYAVQHIQCAPQECIFVDNSVQNLRAAQELGMNTVLFNRDNETYSGNIVNNFQELDRFLKDNI